ncbi:MAG: hypothetical protein MH825_13130 [Cyanobacteria bacterium]|nr:hypothetical protein [Cyanobacteriota bacterium]
MSKFFADLDGTTKPEFSIAGESTIFTRAGGGIEIANGGGIYAGPVHAYAMDSLPNQMGGGIMILAGGPEAGQLGSDYGVKLLSRDTMMASYALRFPATAPAAETVSLLTAQGENLGFVPLATLAAGAVKVEKKIVQFASGDNAWVTLPPQAEIWRLRMAIKTQYAGFSTPPRLTLGITGNLTQFLDVNFASIDNSAGTIIDLAPKVMEASGAELVVGFTGNGATAGQLALYCEYMIPNV